MLSTDRYILPIGMFSIPVLLLLYLLADHIVGDSTANRPGTSEPARFKMRPRVRHSPTPAVPAPPVIPVPVLPAGDAPAPVLL